MLRSVGIPSRVITGFRGAEFNQVNSTYIVRAHDAHSWVEAYIPGAGWTTFDPTPAGEARVVTAWTRAQLYLDAAREFWREWIVNYDAAHQQALSISGARKTRNRMAEFRHWAGHQYERLLDTARKVHRLATRNPKRLLRPGIGLLAMLLLVVVPLAAVHIRNVSPAADIRAPLHRRHPSTPPPSITPNCVRPSRASPPPTSTPASALPQMPPPASLRSSIKSAKPSHGASACGRQRSVTRPSACGLSFALPF